MRAASALDTYLSGLDEDLAAQVRDVAAAIRRAHVGFDAAIKYRILMYAIAGDWRHWVVAIDARPKVVSVKFLAGVLLSDPRHVLRAGSSVLKSWDIKRGAAIDGDGLTAYVREAVERYPEYRANEKAIEEDARRAAAEAGRRPG